jgi:hypothetical protein
VLNQLVGCGLLPKFREFEPPTNPNAASKDISDGSSTTGGGLSSNPTPASIPGAVRPQTPIPGTVTTPPMGASQPSVQCTFRMQCIQNGNSGVNFSGFCLNQQVPVSLSTTTTNGSPVFPQCAQVMPIMAEPLPTGKHSTTLEGGATLKAFCNGMNFVLQNGGLDLRMNVPQAVCLELRDRINALKL